MASANSQTFPSPDAPPEPSMEDILASIRRIIASDQHGAGRSFGQPSIVPDPGPPKADLPSPALVSVSPVFVPNGGGSSAPELPPLDDLETLILPPRPLSVDDGEADRAGLTPAFETVSDEALVAEIEEAATPIDAVDPAPLLSSESGASITSSFRSLADSVLVNDPEMIERLTREALRPMLKSWLDDNLPSMVERLVRAEIERVARGGRSRG